MSPEQLEHLLSVAHGKLVVTGQCPECKYPLIAEEGCKFRSNPCKEKYVCLSCTYTKWSSDKDLMCITCLGTFRANPEQVPYSIKEDNDVYFCCSQKCVRAYTGPPESKPFKVPARTGGKMI
jgi:hypothetical protein